MSIQFSKSIQPIRLFMSYSTKDKRLAQLLANELTSFSIEPFLAHQDLRVSSRWEQKILNEIKRCDGFLSLLTESFANSQWTDQECGYALALRKDIFPVAIPQIPYGFMNTFEAVKSRNRDPRIMTLSILRSLSEMLKFKERLKPGFLRRWCWAKNTTESATLTEILENLAPFSKSDMNILLQWIPSEAHSQSASTQRIVARILDREEQHFSISSLSLFGQDLHLSSRLRRLVKEYRRH